MELVNITDAKLRTLLDNVGEITGQDYTRSYGKHSIRTELKKPDQTTLNDKKLIFYLIESGMKVCDAMAATCDSEVVKWEPNGEEITKKLTIKAGVQVQAIISYIFLKGDWPKCNEGPVPQIIKGLLETGGISVTSEKDVYNLCTDEGIHLPIDVVTAQGIKLPSKLINRFKLNSAGHKFVKIAHKIFPLLTAAGEAYEILKKITDVYKADSVYASLLPGGRSKQLPTGNFMFKFLSLCYTALKDSGKEGEIEEFIKSLNKNELRNDELEYLRGEKVIIKWKDWKPSTWDAIEVNFQ